MFSSCVLLEYMLHPLLLHENTAMDNGPTSDRKKTPVFFMLWRSDFFNKTNIFVFCIKLLTLAIRWSYAFYGILYFNYSLQPYDEAIWVVLALNIFRGVQQFHLAGFHHTIFKYFRRFKGVKNHWVQGHIGQVILLSWAHLIFFSVILLIIKLYRL